MGNSVMKEEKVVNLERGNEVKIDWKILYTLGALYVVATSGLYLFGYWGVFNINILPYMDISEIIRFSLYNMSIVLIFTLIGALLGFVISLPLKKELSIAMQKHEDAPLLKKIWHTRNIHLVVILSFIILVFNGAWLILIAVPISFLLEKNVFFSSIVKNKVVGSIVAFTLCAYPGMSYNEGKRNAENIQNNKTYDFVDETNTYSPNLRLKLLGKTSDYFFFATLDNVKTIIVNKNDAGILTLEHFEKVEDKNPTSAESGISLIDKFTSLFAEDNKPPEQVEKPKENK